VIAPLILLRGADVALADVVQVARHHARVALAPDARRRVVAARALVDRLAPAGPPIYGVNSALGANTGQPIPAAELAAYQERAVDARAVGVGPPFPADVVRAMLFARAAGMAVGGSGVSPAVLDALLAMLNADVHPVVPGTGSIGAADLAPLAHLVLPLLGRGRAEYRGEVLPGDVALARAGLAPVRLAAKDGLALISANAATVGHGALVLRDCADVLDALNIAAALSLEGFRANLSPLDPRVQAARPAPGQREVAARLTALLADAHLWQAGAPRRVQDPVSLRCVAQVHGAALAALRNARDHIELELNCAADSPLVLTETGEMPSTGNFHVPGLAIAFDTLGLALAHTAMLCVQRCQKLMSPALSGLPLQLTRHGPDHSGFAAVQKTLVALYNAVRHLAHPASLDGVPVSEAVEDHAPMAPRTVAKAGEMAVHLRMLAAVELLVAAQAVDLRELPPDALGAGTRAAQRAVRALVPTLDHDRPLGPEIEAVEHAIGAGALAAIDLLAR
jgi:histidine ammonia-lyase